MRLLGKLFRQGPDSIFGRLAGNASWLLGADVLSLLFKVAQGFIIARALGVSDFGALALIVAFVATISQLIDFRVWETAIKFVIEQREAGDLVRARATVKLCYGIDLVSGVAGAALVYGLAGFGAELFVKDPETVEMIRLYGLSILFMLPAGTSSALLRVADRFDALAIKSVVVTALRFSGVVAVLAMGGGVAEVLVVFVAVSVVDGVTSFALASRALAAIDLSGWWGAPLSSLRGTRRRIAGFLLQTNAGAIFKLLQREADVLLVGYFLSDADAGYFRLARSVTDVLRFPLAPLYSACYPEFSRLWERRQISDLRRLGRVLLKLLSIGAIVGGAILVLVAAPLIELVVGTEYLPAVPVVYWLAAATAIEIVSALGHPFLLASDHAMASLIAIATGVATQMVLLVTLLPEHGVVAAGAAQLGFMVVWASIVGLAVRRVIDEVA